MTKTILSTIMLAALMLSAITILTTQNVFADSAGPSTSEDEITTDAIAIIAGSSTIDFDALPQNNNALGTSLVIDGVSFSTSDRTLATDPTFSAWSQPNLLSAHVVGNDHSGNIIIELPANTCATDIQFHIVNPPFSAEGFDVSGNLLHTITSSGSFTEVFDFTGFDVHKVVIDGTFYGIDDFTFSPVSCSDPILDEILQEVKDIWMAIQNEIIPLLTNIDAKLDAQTEKVSVTVNLDDIKLKTGEVMVLLDTTGTGKLSTVHVAANLPCNLLGDGKPTDGGANDDPSIWIVAGVDGGGLSGVINDATDDTGSVGPDKTCVFQDTIDAADVDGGIITDVIIIHPDNHPPMDDKKDEPKKHEKLKGVVVTITGTYN